MRVAADRSKIQPEDYFLSSSRIVRWIVLVLVLITFPFGSSAGIVVLTGAVVLSAYNGLHLLRRRRSIAALNSRINSLVIDHVFVFGLLIFTGGLASPYYPLVFPLILASIISYGMPGFAFSLGTQAIFSLILLSNSLPALPPDAASQFVIKLVIIIIFSLMAEKSLRRRPENQPQPPPPVNLTPPAQPSSSTPGNQFIAVTSHELRTPLAIVEANLSTALLPGYAKIDSKARVLIDQAHQQSVFMSELIEDLTALSRAQSHDLKLKFELLDSAEIAGELARDFLPLAQAKQLELSLELGSGIGSLVSSRPQLREILRHLLTNAIKYTSTGHVTLGVHAVAGGTEFSVTDTGIGISASDKPKIFGKFYRSPDHRAGKTGGTGLGLYITRQLATKLGVEVSFDSRLNHGSTFRVLVPVRSDAAASMAIAQAAQAPGLG